MSDETQVSLRDDLMKCAEGATALPSSGRGWPVGPGDGLLYVRESLCRGDGERATRAIIKNAARSAQLLAHSPRPIAHSYISNETKKRSHIMIILASASPRRKEILREMGLDFTVIPSAYEEDNTRAISPKKLTELQARGKAEEVAKRVFPKDPVLGADTVVVLAGEILGKPKDRADAKNMLRKLSGKTHLVMTGVAVVFKGNIKSAVCVTEVKFRDISEKEIDDYIATGEPMDKAGAYAIQGIGQKFVESVRGSRSNVIGLPKQVTAKLLGGISHGDDQ